MATTILIAVDFEGSSRRAIDVAKQLAPALDAELVLVHAYELPVYTYPGLEPMILPGFHGEVTQAARRALTALSDEVGIPSTMLRDGNPVRELLAAAKERHASMIVMGTHGRKGISHALLGSVAEKVIRQSEIPVLTVRSDEEG